MHVNDWRKMLILTRMRVRGKGLDFFVSKEGCNKKGQIYFHYLHGGAGVR